MTTRVAFLRAVNLGRRKAPSATLVSVAEALGHDDVWTYVNSGNVVFDATGSRTDIERAFEQAFEAELGFETTTFVRTAKELEAALAANPFPVAAGDTYFVTFLKSAATKAQRSGLEDLSNDFDTLVVDGRDVHWRMRGKSTDTKVPKRAWERVIGVNQSSSRNTTMLRKLLGKIEARA